MVGINWLSQVPVDLNSLVWTWSQIKRLLYCLHNRCLIALRCLGWETLAGHKFMSWVHFGVREKPSGFLCSANCLCFGLYPFHFSMSLVYTVHNESFKFFFCLRDTCQTCGFFHCFLTVFVKSLSRSTETSALRADFSHTTLTDTLTMRGTCSELWET